MGSCVFCAWGHWTAQAAAALRKMDLNKAKKYLEDVMAHKRAVPFLRYSGSTGRTAQAKNEGNPGGQARWPVKSAEFLLNLLRNAESNAEVRIACKLGVFLSTGRMTGGMGQGSGRQQIGVG